ncbi:MAG: ribonuclease J [Alphaproteobacteria bacterium]
MTKAKAARAAATRELLFLPLGGAGEVGMNLSLYGCGGKWLMVDLGITFAGEVMPGVEVLMPDPAFIVERRDDLLGLVLTHAHEDHLGAVPYLWPRLKCPVYASPFTAAVLRPKLFEAGLADQVDITEVPVGGAFDLGPFALEFITLTHSIPESAALIIRTPAGAVLHTGDWKLDSGPLVGPVSDEAALNRLGEEGVLAMVCDSTNALRPGESGSEAALRESLIELVEGAKGRVVIACFASNVARLETVAAVAAAHGRHAALVGRSLWRIYEAARETGYLSEVAFLNDRDGGLLPRDKVLLACTGSQGEPRSALARIGAGDHPHVALDPGDTVIFSSRIIPGNERAIFRLQNQLVGLGVEVISERTHFVHVSGHPNQDELMRMYQWVRPEVAVPVHGEGRHLAAHAELARACQVPQVVVVENGSLLRLAPGRAEIVEQVGAGRLALDGTELIAVDGAVLKSRYRMARNGVAVATLVLDGGGRLAADPQLTVHGLLEAEGEDEIKAEAIAAIRRAVEALPVESLSDGERVREAARLAVRRAFNESRGKRPLTEVHLVRL